MDNSKTEVQQVSSSPSYWPLYHEPCKAFVTLLASIRASCLEGPCFNTRTKIQISEHAHIPFN